jgi:hypothetical protein
VNATHVAECFWPDAHEAGIEAAADRLRLATDALAGSPFVPGDDVVFCLFESASEESVREACERAEIPVERVPETVWRGGPAARPGPD